LGQVERVAKCLRNGASGSNGGKIEDGEARLAEDCHK